MPETETWVYCGKWVDTKKRLRDRWQDADGRDLIFAKVTGTVIGGLYTLQVTREGEGITVHGTARYAGERLDDNERLTAIVKDDSAQRIFHAQHRRELRAADEDPLDEAMEPLLHYAKTCRSRPEKDALIATVLRRLTDTW